MEKTQVSVTTILKKKCKKLTETKTVWRVRPEAEPLWMFLYCAAIHCKIACSLRSNQYWLIALISHTMSPNCTVLKIPTYSDVIYTEFINIFFKYLFCTSNYVTGNKQEKIWCRAPSKICS